MVREKRRRTVVKAAVVEAKRRPRPRWQRKTNDRPGPYRPRRRFAIARIVPLATLYIILFIYVYSVFYIKKIKMHLYYIIIIITTYYIVILIMLIIMTKVLE